MNSGPLSEQPPETSHLEHLSLREAHEHAATTWPKIEPLSAESFLLQATIRQSTHENMLYCQDLLGSRVAPGDIPELLERAFLALVRELEKTRFAATSKPRRGRGSSDPRYIPLEVKRAVWKRDGGRCTFVGTNGHRCTACRHLHFDHVIPIAKGGTSTVDNLRLLCAAHNQHEAERVFGVGLMEKKREAAQAAAAERRAAVAERRERAEAERAEKRAKADAERDEKRSRAETERAAKQAQAEVEMDSDRSVVPWLLKLHVSLAEACRIAALCQHLANAPLEERVRFALRQLAPPRRVERAPAMAT